MHMKIFKRNQIIISVIALMLITVGYMNYSSNVLNAKEVNSVPSNNTENEIAGLGDARLVNGEVKEEVISDDERSFRHGKIR